METTTPTRMKLIMAGALLFMLIIGIVIGLIIGLYGYRGNYGVGYGMYGMMGNRGGWGEYSPNPWRGEVYQPYGMMGGYYRWLTPAENTSGTSKGATTTQ